MPPVIVAVHYRLAADRLAAWFGWNAEGVIASGARVIIVADQPYPAPPWAEVLVYPEPMAVFSLTRTANFGIRRAVDTGADLIIKTDADCLLTVSWWRYVLGAVRPGQALCPRYWMVQDADELEQAAKHPCIIGTLAMAGADWSRLHGYRETMEGYGVDDCDIRDRALAAGIAVPLVDAPRLYHIAHQAGTPQGRTRTDQHGRAAGFNPRNHIENRKRLKTPWICPEWGRPGGGI